MIYYLLAGHRWIFHCGATSLAPGFKKHGEDAFFISSDHTAFGVADGVGGISLQVQMKIRSYLLYYTFVWN